MKSIMKYYIISVIFMFFGTFSLFAQQPTTESTLNALWLAKQYNSIETFLINKMSLDQPDIVAVHCSKFFFIFVKPDKIKALAAATKLKQIADVTANAEFKALATQGITEVQALPENEFLPPQEVQLNQLHVLFPEKFPNIELSLKLKNYLIP